MGLFSFLFKDHRRSQDYDYQEDISENTSLLQSFSSPDPSEDVSDATMMIPQVRKRTIPSTQPAQEESLSPASEDTEGEMDDLMNAISSAVERKTTKPHRVTTSTESMLSNVASVVAERETKSEAEAPTAVLPHIHAASTPIPVASAVPENESVSIEDTIGETTHIVFPPKAEEQAALPSDEPYGEQHTDKVDTEIDALTESSATAEENLQKLFELMSGEKPMEEASDPTSVEEPVEESPEQILFAEETLPTQPEQLSTEQTAVPKILESMTHPSLLEPTMDAEYIPAPTAALMEAAAEPFVDRHNASIMESTAEDLVAECTPVAEDSAEAPSNEFAQTEEISVSEELTSKFSDVAETIVPTPTAQFTATDNSQDDMAESSEDFVPIQPESAERMPNLFVSEMLSSVAASAEEASTPTAMQPNTDEIPKGTASEAQPDSADHDETAWGANWISPDAAIPSDSDEYFRLTWKLKGTGKKRRLRAISECVKGQPVYITCGSDDSECTVITEDGEEIGRLTEQDSMIYHTLVSAHPHNMYIKSIRSIQFEKTKVKILVIVRRNASDAADVGIISES